MVRARIGIPAIFFLIIGFIPPAQVEGSALHFSLAQAEEEAFRTSPRLRTAKAEWESAREKAGSQFGAMVPRLSLDGSYRYVTVVPTFQPVPSSPAIQFGDNKNYSFGPQISWTVFSSGQLYNRWKSSDLIAKSKENEFEALKRELSLETRSAYFMVQLALEEVYLLADSLKLVQDQYRDISLRRKAGTLSRIDSLSAHGEVFNRVRELRQAQVELAGALRKFFTLTGLGQGMDPSVPMDGRMENKLPVGSDTPTFFVSLDSIEESKGKLSPAAHSNLDISHPEILALTHAAEAARESAQAIRGGHGPTLTLSAKATRDYPNGPVLEPINQKTLMATASLPIFSGNQIVHEARAQDAEARAGEGRRDQAGLDLTRQWEEAQDSLKGLKAQEIVNRESVAEAETLSKLVYDSYKAGSSTYLDVETANLRVLQTKVTSVRNEVQILIQLAILDSLAVK